MSREILSGQRKWWGQIRHLLVPDRIWQLVWLRHLPGYFRSAVQEGCPLPKWRIAWDLLWIFFRLRIVPEHYTPCHLWEVPREKWALYYGSPYTPIQRGRLAKSIYPFAHEVLYNDKRVGAMLGRGLDVRQPRMLGMLEPCDALQDAIRNYFDLSGKSRLLLKPAFGRGGMGIILLERNGGDISARIGSQTIPLAQLKLDWPVFVQEVIEQDPRIAAIWPTSVNTIRLTTLCTDRGEVVLLGAGMRFGRGDSYVDNWSAGGISVGIDVPTGRLRKYAYDKDGNRYAEHPGSKVSFEGFQLPEWQSLVDAARAIQLQLPFSRLTGADLCLDHTATPVLIEINGLPDLVPIEQLNGPLLANERVLQTFAAHGLLVSREQRHLLQQPAADAASAAGSSSSPQSPPRQRRAA